MDIPNSLKGFACSTIGKNVRIYLDMLASSDIENLYLAVGFIKEDLSLLNYFDAKFGREEFLYFKFLIDLVLDKTQSEGLRYLYITRITKNLVRLVKNPIYCYNGSEK